MLDVCVAHPSAPSRVRLAPGSALKYRENGKISAYEPLPRRQAAVLWHLLLSRSVA